jgi:hypothetical protein
VITVLMFDALIPRAEHRPEELKSPAAFRAGWAVSKSVLDLWEFLLSFVVSEVERS